MRLGFEGGQASARTLLKEGDVRFVALSWGGAVPPTDLRRRVQAAGLDRPPLAALAGPRQVPRPPVAQLPAAQRADAEGPDLRADRRDRRRRAPRRCPRRRAATATTTTASPGSGTPRSRCGGCTRSASTGRRVDFFSFIADIAERRRRPADHVRHRRRARARRSTSSTTCPGYADSRPVRIGNAAYAQQQHDVWGALLDSVYLHSKAVDHLDNRIWPILDKQVARGAQALARARRRDLGGARGAAALHLVQDHVLGRGRPRRPAGPDERARTARPPSGSWRPRRSRRTSSPTASTSAACSPSTTAARRSTRRCCSPRCVRFLPAGRPAHPRHRAGDRATS